MPDEVVDRDNGASGIINTSRSPRRALEFFEMSHFTATRGRQWTFGLLEMISFYKVYIYEAPRKGHQTSR